MKQLQIARTSKIGTRIGTRMGTRTRDGVGHTFFSPAAPRPQWVEDFREAVVRDSIRRDTSGLELLLSCLMLINGLQVLDPTAQGAWLAPFVRMAHASLHIAPFFWAACFIGLGMWKAGICLKGWRGDDCYKERMKATFVGSGVWALILVAILVTHQPPLIAWRYMVYGFFSLACHIVLRIKDNKLPRTGCG